MSAVNKLQVHRHPSAVGVRAWRPELWLGPVLTWLALTACANNQRAGVDSHAQGGHERSDGGAEAAFEPSELTPSAAGSDAASPSARADGSTRLEDSLSEAESSDAAVQSSLDLNSLRFSKIKAGRGHWCGITQPDQDLVCVSDTARVELTGPIVDFDMSHDLVEFHHWCAVTGEGRVVCMNEQMEFAGQAEHVAVGFFNACASDSAHVECFFSDAVGGFTTPPSAGGAISAEMGALCFAARDFHASCYGPQGDELLPRNGHYLDVVAIPDGACAAVIAPPTELPMPDAGAAINRALSHSGVVCFRGGGVEVKLSGTYSLLDADVNGDGCAYGGEQDEMPRVRCWGAHATTVPSGVGTPMQIAVASSQVCILDQQGRVTCYEQP